MLVIPGKIHYLSVGQRIAFLVELAAIIVPMQAEHCTICREPPIAQTFP
jgi:hypothetical protein